MSSSSSNKKKVPVKAKKVTANQVATALAKPTLDEQHSEVGSEFGELDTLEDEKVIRKESVVINDFTDWAIKGGVFQINVRCPHMTPGEDGKGVLVGPKGNRGVALFPCLTSIISEEEFEEMDESERCRCMQGDREEIYHVVPSPEDFELDVGGTKITYVNAFLANNVELATSHARSNCDYLLMNAEEKSSWLSHFCPKGQEVYKDVWVLLRTTRKTQLGMRYQLSDAPLITKAQWAKMAAEKIAMDEAEKALDSDWEEEGPAKKKAKSSDPVHDSGGSGVRKSSREKVSGEVARAEAIIAGRVHAYEASLTEKLDHVAVRNDVLNDVVKEHIQRSEVQMAKIAASLGDLHGAVCRQAARMELLRRTVEDHLLGPKKELSPEILAELQRKYPLVYRTTTSSTGPTPSVGNVVYDSAGEAVADYEPESEEEA
jgi:hypothetical protein